MPDTLERDPLADTFFQFRIQAPHELSVPGAAAAKQTVRRRRATRLVLTSMAVLTVTAGIGMLATRDVTVNEPAATITTTGTGRPPTLNPQQLDELGVQALARLGHQPEKSRPGMLFGGMTAATNGFTYTMGTPAEPFPQGDYELTAACLGDGNIEVTWTETGQIRHLPVACGDSKPTASSQVHLTLPGTITLSLQPDTAAQGRAGAAITLTDPRTVASRNALVPRTDQAMGGSGFAERDSNTGKSIDRMDLDQSGTRPGTYTLTVTCTGSGSIKATLTIGDSTSATTAHCTALPAPPSPATIAIRIGQAGLPVSVQLQADEQAAGSAGYAYSVVVS